MNINLSEKIADHFTRLENLSKEAEADEAQSYNSRASAMTALTAILRDLTKAQQEIINMERLMRVENVVIETVRKFLTSEQHSEFLKQLEERINAE